METTELSMLKYIKETPHVVRKNIAESEKLTRRISELFIDGAYKNIKLIACGSSYNAALCARYYMEKHLKVPVQVITPFTFNHYEHNVREIDFVVCISQSGCSTNTIDSLRICRKNGIPAIGMTGNIHSDFQKEADELIDFGLYEESLEFVTKGVVTEIAFLMLFALHTAQQLGHIDSEYLLKEKKKMLEAIDNYEYIINNFHDFWIRNKKNLLTMKTVYCIGAGANYGTALEAAVKIGETVHIPAIGYEVDEAIHGPQHQLTPQYSFLFIDPGDSTKERIEQSFRAAQKITDKVYILSNNPNLQEDSVMRVPNNIDEILSPLYALAFIQMIAYTVAQTKLTWNPHPLLKDYKAILTGKSESYRSYDCT